jgi:glycerophosphoryl diester phosphodiesterase
VSPITFAHRGARAEEPDNTLPAFSRALELGAEGLESDAWLAADGQVVLVHDPVVRRGLRRLRVARATVGRLAANGIPRLADLYAACGTGYELSLDVMEARAARPIIEVARAAGDDALGRLWLCSPDVGLLAQLRAEGDRPHLVHSERKRAIDKELERHAADLAAAGIDAMNMHHTEWTKGLVALFHRFGVRAFAWDVQEPRHLRAVLQKGVDALYSDHVARMVAVVREWASG